MKRHLLAAICIGLSAFAGQAQNFDDYFVNKTIRADYIFSGNSEAQAICLDELSSLPQWAGRRHHLSELPLAGNGEIEMKDKASGKIIYRTSFSSLFVICFPDYSARNIKKHSFFFCRPFRDMQTTRSKIVSEKTHLSCYKTKALSSDIKTGRMP